MYVQATGAKSGMDGVPREGVYERRELPTLSGGRRGQPGPLVRGRASSLRRSPQHLYYRQVRGVFCHYIYFSYFLTESKTILVIYLWEISIFFISIKIWN